MIPTLFVAHGSPMIAIEQSEYGDFLDHLGAVLPKPKAIVLFSAHWESTVQMVSEVDSYSTMYDFGGFPDALYRVTYPAKGDPALARKIEDLLVADGIPCAMDRQRGLDHGAWTILHRIYPEAGIPVVTLSVNPDLTPEQQYQIGHALSPLRTEDVLIIGSGVTVHNFQLFQVSDKPEVQSAVREFEAWLEEKLQAGERAELFDYERQAPHARLAVPKNGKEHFIPLFYALGAAGDRPAVKMLHRSWLFNILANTVYQFV